MIAGCLLVTVLYWCVWCTCAAEWCGICCLDEVVSETCWLKGVVSCHINTVPLYFWTFLCTQTFRKGFECKWRILIGRSGYSQPGTLSAQPDSKAKNWCLNDVITFTLHQPEDGGSLLLCDDRIKHTVHYKNLKHNHCLDNSFNEPSLCWIMYHTVKPYGEMAVRSACSSWH